MTWAFEGLRMMLTIQLHIGAPRVHEPIISVEGDSKMTIEKKSGKVERVIVRESNQKPEFRGKAMAHDSTKGSAPANFVLPEPTKVPAKPAKDKE